MIVNRPLEITTWITLLNFLKLNTVKYRFKNIITNVGFVDHTPKKLAYIKDNIEQAKLMDLNNCHSYNAIELFKTQNGKFEQLYTNQYNKKMIKALESVIDFDNLTVINTPEVKKNIRINRKRPKSFFSQIVVGNNFNKKLPFVNLIECPKFDLIDTYDAVHYTSHGARKIFNLFIEKYERK